MARLGRSQPVKAIRLKADIVFVTVTAVGSSVGTSTVQATGASTSEQVASAAGTVLVADFIGASTSAQVGSSSGSVTIADFINGTATLVTAVGEAAGTATVLGISQQASTDTHDGFDPYARKRKAKGGKRKKEVEDLLAKLMGLVPEDAPEEIEQAVEVAKATVERISAPQVDYTDQIAALQTAQLQLAKLDALLRSYEDEEEDEDLLLMSM